jgi:hypothetical protein
MVVVVLQTSPRVEKVRLATSTSQRRTAGPDAGLGTPT